MTREEKFRMKRRMGRRMIVGDTGLVLKWIAVIMYLIGLVFVWNSRDRIAALTEGVDLLAPPMEAVLHHSTEAYLLTAGVGLIYVLVYPFEKRMAEDRFTSIGLVDHAGIAPRLRSKRRDPNHPNVTIWTFRGQGIPLIVWEDKKAAIESALDISIVKITYGRSKSEILIHAVPSSSDLLDTIAWDDRMLSPNSFVLTLGESLLGPVTVDLTHIPHILLGGSTGSGKSVLLKLLLMQAVHKGAEVYIADFKGGVDFPAVWHEKCHLCFEEHELLEVLTSLVDELQRRKILFKDKGCPDLDTYDQAAKEPLKRIIFACDEVAELLDKTGLTKEQKELVSRIESKLSIIARQGRAFGIHMILATQRPDANVLPGQIKNNIDCRICGRADNVLSQIILDNTDAADQIPKDARGRFLRNDGTMFQAYWFDEREL